MPRFIAVNSFSLNVEAVKRIEYLSAHDRDMEFAELFPSNSGSSKHEKGAVVIRHDDGPGISIEVDNDHYGMELIKLVTHEIVHGTEKLIDPIKMEANM